MMKKLLVSALFCSSALFANEALVKNMHDMESGMDYIQKGYLYNNIELVKNGIKEIQKANAILKGMDTSSYLPENKKHMANIALNSATKMDEALESMKSYIDKKEIVKSHDAYSNVLSSCVICHSLVRNW